MLHLVALKHNLFFPCYHYAIVWRGKLQDCLIREGICVGKLILLASAFNHRDLESLLKHGFINFNFKQPSLYELFTVNVHTMESDFMQSSNACFYTNCNLGLLIRLENLNIPVFVSRGLYYLWIWTEDFNGSLHWRPGLQLKRYFGTPCLHFLAVTLQGIDF